jgi:hypothetical protein
MPLRIKFSGSKLNHMLEMRGISVSSAQTLI